MATACIAQVTFRFEPKGKPVVAAFDIPDASSDGGLVLLRGIDTQLHSSRPFQFQLILAGSLSSHRAEPPCLSTWPRPRFLRVPLPAATNEAIRSALPAPPR